MVLKFTEKRFCYRNLRWECFGCPQYPRDSLFKKQWYTFSTSARDSEGTSQVMVFRPAIYPSLLTATYQRNHLYIMLHYMRIPV